MKLIIDSIEHNDLSPKNIYQNGDNKLFRNADFSINNQNANGIPIEDALNRMSSTFDLLSSMKKYFDIIDQDPIKSQEKLLKANKNLEKKQEEHK